MYVHVCMCAYVSLKFENERDVFASEQRPLLEDRHSEHESMSDVSEHKLITREHESKLIAPY